MRIIREFPFTDHIKASLFSWNGKYILKLETDQLEQTYKIRETETGGESEILDYCLSPDFRKVVEDNFQRMGASWPPES